MLKDCAGKSIVSITVEFLNCICHFVNYAENCGVGQKFYVGRFWDFVPDHLLHLSTNPHEARLSRFHIYSRISLFIQYFWTSFSLIRKSIGVAENICVLHKNSKIKLSKSESGRTWTLSQGIFHESSLKFQVF